jgi:hypothetical protein
MYEKRKPKWDWRSFLTPEEKSALARADKAKAAWLKLNKERASITNRAIQRAKYAAAQRGEDDGNYIRRFSDR